VQRQGTRGWGTSCTDFAQSWELTEGVALPWDAGSRDSSWGTLGTSGRKGVLGTALLLAVGVRHSRTPRREPGKGE